MDILNITFLALSHFYVIDLTHSLDEKTMVWDGTCGYSVKLTGDYNQGGFRGQEYTMRSCLGTHMDMPAHCYKDASDCATIDIKNCVVPAYVIDLSDRAHEDYGISVNDIQAFEYEYKKIESGSVVLFSTGWANRWSNYREFRNEKGDGIPHFPYLSKEAAQLLLERGVVGIGIDTLSPDPFYFDDAPVHKLLLGTGKYIIENIANLEKMPPTGSFIVALPLKIKGGVESPIRLIGLVDKK